MTNQERLSFRKLTQNTPEWLTARKGRVTASRCADVATKIAKGTKYSAARYDYMMELIVEQLTGRAQERFVTQAMEWGIEQQPFAQAAYEMKQGVMVEDVGLIIHPEKDLFAASPDGLTETGIVEFKCPTSRVHLEYMKAGVVPDDYLPQIKAQLACMPEREYCDFVSFDPRLPFGLQLFIRRYYRDAAKITELETEVDKFLGEMRYQLMELTTAKPIEVRDLAEQLTESLGAV